MLHVAQSTGDPTKTNFYSSDLEVLVSFPSENNRAVVIPGNRMDNANNAISKYQAGNMSSAELYNSLFQHGQEYYLNITSDCVTIRKPRDFSYYLRLFGYAGTRGKNRRRTGDMPFDPRLDSYGSIIVDW